MTEMIVFSDGLDVPTCLKLKKAADEAGSACSFGVGKLGHSYPPSADVELRLPRLMLRPTGTNFTNGTTA